MKKILIILAFIPLFLGAQYQTTNLDFLFNGSITVNGSDTLLVDSITGTFDLGYVLTDVDFDITLGYIPGKSKVLLNGYPVICYFPNLNYSDTLFTQWINHTVNADSTENTPFRVQRIAHYSTATTDVNDFFNTPTIDGSAAYVPGDYSTIQAAVTGEGVDGVIYVNDGTYKDASYTTLYQNTKVVGIGLSVWQSTSTSYLARSNGGNSDISYMYIDSEANTTYNVFTTAGYTELRNNYLADALTYSVYESAADSFLTEKCVIIGGVDHCGFGAEMKIRETLMNTDGISCIYTLNEATVKDIYNEYNLYRPIAIQYIHWIRSNGNYNIRFNEYDIGIDLTNQVEVREGADDGIINFYGNTTNTSFASTALLWRAFKGNTFDINIYNNVWGWTAQGDGSCIRIEDVASIDIYGNIFTSEQSIDYEYISVRSDEAATVCTTNIYENDFNIRNATGYGIRVGDEATGTGDNNITALIEENRVFGALDNDSTLTGISFHGIFVGFQDGSVMRYNYVKGAGFNELFKGVSSGDYYGNITINGTTLLRLKGATGVNIYNNSFYTDIPITSQVVSLTENLGADPSSATFRNNIIQTIFNTNTKTLYNIQDNSTITTNNNVVYTDSDLYANVNLSTYTWAGWQGLGQDADSYNTDPNYNSTLNLWPVVPSDAIGNGFNLGSTYENGLDRSSTWPDNVLTTPQLSEWTIGAYVVPLGNRAVTSNQLILIKDGKQLIFNR